MLLQKILPKSQEDGMSEIIVYFCVIPEIPLQWHHVEKRARADQPSR